MSICCHCLQSCNRPYKSCDSCHMPIHSKCLDLSESELKIITSSKSTHLKIFCNRCKSTLNSINDLKSLITELQRTVDQKLQTIEDSISNAKLNLLDKEEIIQEAVERSIRSYNVILYNVPEKKDVNDTDIANDILECIDSAAVVSPEDVVRIGKSDTKKQRPLKLSFKKVDMAKLVLRKSSALKNSQFNKIMVSSDKTRQQQEYFRNLKNELNVRRRNGENNCVIKFLNNVPRIVTVNSNSQSNNYSHLN